MPTVYPRPLSIVRSFHRSNMSNHGVTSCRVHSPLLRGTIVLRAHTALTMIRSRHAVGRGFVALSPARSAGCPSTAAARAVSSQRDLSCPHSARPASKDAASASCSTFDHYRQYNSSSVRYYSASDSVLSSPFSGGIRIGNDSSTSEARKSNRKRKFIPRKAAVALTPKARTFFKSLLENVTSNQNDTDGKQSEDAIIGIQLTYSQSTTGEPRMVFGFSFLRASALHPNVEAVSLEVMEDGETPKPPADALEDGLPKLYVHHDAVLKVLGATLDVDQERLLPILYDKEGNVMDPNA